MRDGIYRVDFQSGQYAGKGIAMLSSGKFTGVDQTRVYFGRIEGQSGKVNALMYATSTTGAPAALSMKEANILILTCKEIDGRFVLSGESIAQPGTWYEIKGEWIADL